MKRYLVGGAVRDALLGLPVGDRDWVVVGADPDAMRAQGYLAVGRDFPVFLHPETREEHALARTERKTGPGYHGFEFHADPSVTLEDDLARRDLTINAMAQDDSGALVDPHGRIHAETPYGKAAVLEGEVSLARGTTPFQLAGEAPVALAAAAVVLSTVRRLRTPDLPR